jgi:hypothetical protein
VVSFKTRPLYPRGKGPQYPSDRRFVGPQSRSGRSAEEKILAPVRTGTLNPAHSQSLYQLLYPGSFCPTSMRFYVRDSAILQTSHHWILSRGFNRSPWCTTTGRELLVRFRTISMPRAQSLLQRHCEVCALGIMHRIRVCNRTDTSSNIYCSECTKLCDIPFT